MKVLEIARGRALVLVLEAARHWHGSVVSHDAARARQVERRPHLRYPPDIEVAIVKHERLEDGCSCDLAAAIAELAALEVPT